MGRAWISSNMYSKVTFTVSSWDFLKWSTNKVSMPLWSSTALQSSYLSCRIRFLALLYFTTIWKYFVFLSPKIIRLHLAFWPHITSSLCIRVSRSSLRIFSFLTTSIVRMEFCKVWSWSCLWEMFCSTLPKTSLF